MILHKFKPGDKVRLITARGKSGFETTFNWALRETPKLDTKTTYKVEGVNERAISLKGYLYYHPWQKFKKVKS